MTIITRYAGILAVSLTLAILPSIGLADPASESDDMAAAFLEKEQIPGMAITVSRGGQIVWSEGFGYADLEQGVRIRPELTRFRVGSVSKPMTAMAVALLYERSKLELDRIIQVYVPSFPKKSMPITVRLLGGHLAGIRHYRGNEMLSNRSYAVVLESLKIFQDDPLLHPPRAKFHYSSYGWNLISAAVEGASGRPFLEFMDEEIFRPLGMRHTGPDWVSEIVPDRTRFYVLRSGKIQNAPAVDNSYKWAGGGFLSTTEDLAVFAHAHLFPKLLANETVGMLWRTQEDIAGKRTDYGIGWGSGIDEEGEAWVGHNGGSVGGSTRLRIYPQHELVIAVAANRTGVNFGRFTTDLIQYWRP
ncbi:MAG: beta-lactamase family protein [Verrucomicrobia bacterium]|jgi:serine beta-lactamase-like protein LACTB, mitochondrial|nr:beta-lactamase family protein [Verrucomicrobiota bacterium]